MNKNEYKELNDKINEHSLKDIADKNLHFPIMEEIVDFLKTETRVTNDSFFRTLVIYKMGQLASMFKVSSDSVLGKNIPVNIYALALANCVDEDTEYLSPNGWVKIKDYDGGEIMEVDIKDNFRSFFNKPNGYIKEFNDEFAYRVKPTKRTSTAMHVSGNHVVPYWSLSGSGKYSILEKKAEDFFKMNTMQLVTNFNPEIKTSIDISEEDLRLMVAFCADGYFNRERKHSGMIKVKRKRKIERMRELLKSTIHHEYIQNDGYVAFNFEPAISTKMLSTFAWKASNKQLEIIYDEFVHWDGSIDKRTGNKIFYSTKKEESDFIQYVIASVGDNVASIGRYDEGKFVNSDAMYRVGETNDKKKNVMKSNITREQFPNLTQYCFNTDTGYWLMRKDGFISVTHNSGFSKGMSLGLLEDNIFGLSKQKYMKDVYPDILETSLVDKAQNIALMRSTEDTKELQALRYSFEKFPSFMYSSGAATEEGLKGLMSALSMANTGAVSLELDEIGDTIINNKDVLDTMLVTYDKGKMKNKLRRLDSQKEMDSFVPTNLLAFGTANRLFDGGSSEKTFLKMLDSGYSRRFIYAYVDKDIKKTQSAEDRLMELKMSKGLGIDLFFAQYFESLVDKTNNCKVITFSEEADLMLIKYQMDCGEKAALMGENEIFASTELTHRFFRVLKIATMFAFINKDSIVLEQHIQYAINFVDESGKEFNKIITREKPYIKLAKYLVYSKEPQTQADIMEGLHHYKGTESQRKEMMSLAKDWAYKNSMLITEKINKKNIVFFNGEELEGTELNNIMVSISSKANITEGYRSYSSAWSEYGKLLISDMNYTAHWFIGGDVYNKEQDMHMGYRHESKALKGFNLIILDVDDGLPIETARSALSDYTYMIGTTKRHTEKDHRYRILLPMSKKVKLEPEEYKKFMENVFDFLPFNVDEGTKDIARKWTGNPKAEVYENSGALIDPVQFIEDTDELKSNKIKLSKYADFSKIERWIIINTEGRNKALIKIALAYLDSGKNLDECMSLVENANRKFDEPLEDKELATTVFKTLTKKSLEKEK